MYKFITTLKQLVVSLHFISEDLTFMMYPNIRKMLGCIKDNWEPIPKDNWESLPKDIWEPLPKDNY